MKSSVSVHTDSIENQSLPSLPVPRRFSDKSNKNLTSHTKNKRSNSPESINSNRFFSKIINYQNSFSLPPPKQSKPPELNKINECAVLKVFEHRNFGNSPSNYSRMSEEMSSPYLPKSRSYVQSKAKFFTPSLRTHYCTLELPDEGKFYGKGPKGCIYLPKPRSEEVEFLKLVSDNILSYVEKYLDEHPALNINCVNFQGISALSIAVHNRSEEMVEFLLKYPQVEIGDTALHAVRDSSTKILVLLLNALKKRSPGLEFAGATHSTVYPTHVTPLILAAYLNNYEIVNLLMSRGHRVTRPHSPNCPCIICKNSVVNDDALHASCARLWQYRAVSSPAYLVHVTSDPILEVFYLTEELAANAAAHRHLASDYFQLRDQVSAFAVGLIDSCRTSDEVEIILKQVTGCEGHRHFILPRLLMAVNYKQKEFVAHPNTQQVLESYWLGDWYSWRSKSTFGKTLIFLSRVFIIPLILLFSMLLPRHRLLKHYQIPLNKLITHTAAYFVFLTLVFHVSNQDKSKLKRGPPNTGVEGPLILFVLGYSWSALRMCLMQGPRRFFTVMWNWAEFIMLTLFWLTFVFWIMAAIDAITIRDNIERKHWNQYDPTLLAEGTFCLATIFAFLRLMLLCQLNYHLGPLQVSLGKMTIDIYKYIIVFTIIISAFAAGLARFYQYYNAMVYEDEFGMKTVQVNFKLLIDLIAHIHPLLSVGLLLATELLNSVDSTKYYSNIILLLLCIAASSFTSLSDTLNTLFWALFCMAPVESADIVLENTRGHAQKAENKHGYTERVGYFCFGCFEVISVIVVLNMLIATMSNTFQRVTDNVAIEWTFGKTEVYIDYMWQTALPSPFNLIPTATGVGSVIDWCRAKMCKISGAHARWSLSYCCFVERDIDTRIQKEFPALMSVLTQRYFSKHCRGDLQFYAPDKVNTKICKDVQH